MKLSAAREGQVVRNANNGSHYRYERPEKGRIRIYPLEHFPNGLLIAKPTPTIIDPDIDVVLVGQWHPDMVVAGKPTHSRAKYEAELSRREVELVELLAAYDELPVNGKGKQSRGSHQNKIKNCRSRVGVLQRGLEERTEVAVLVEAETVGLAFRAHDIVQLPSGLPAKVQRGGVMTTVMTRFKGSLVEMAVPAEVLRPWALARCATM